MCYAEIVVTIRPSKKEDTEMAVTIKDIAKLAGVSTATVSRAFSNHDYVNEETKARILRIAEEQHFSIRKYNKKGCIGFHEQEIIRIIP